MLAAQTSPTNSNTVTNTTTNSNITANVPSANAANQNTAAGTQTPTPVAAPVGTPTPVEPFTNVSYIIILVFIMLAAGAFGGFVNYLLNGKDPDEDETDTAKVVEPAQTAQAPQADPLAKKKKKWPEWLNFVLTGIAASFLVPFFLQTSSSELMKQAYSNYLLLLVFAGFCLIASISARAFITTLSSKVLQAAQDAQSTAQKANEKAAEASSKADDAKGTAESARKVASLSANAPAVPTPAEPTTNAGGTGTGGVVSGGESGTGAGTPDTPDSLIAEYAAARSQMNASWTRTDKMAAIFSKMIGTAALMDDFPVEEYIGDTNIEGGKRLFGYAYFFNRPDLALLPQLVSSVINIEKTSFAQYWGIQAIGKVIAERGTTPIDPAIVAQLKAFYETLDPSTDRSIELKNVFALL